MGKVLSIFTLPVPTGLFIIPIIPFSRMGHIMNKLLTIDDQQISDLLQAEGLTVVLITSPWDGNGIILRSIIDDLAGRYRSVNFRVADYETCPRLARLFNLMSPPGILLIREGEMLERLTGPVSAGKISKLIQEAA